MKHIVRSLLGVVCAGVVAGCGGSSHFGGVTGFQGATIRFLNASPSLGYNVDVAIGSPTNILFTNVAPDAFYANATTGPSGYLGYNQKNSPDVFVYQTGTTTLLGGTVQADGQTATGNVALGPKTRDTIVLVGAPGAGLAVFKFEEHIFKTAAGAAGAQWHDAALSLGNATLNVGVCPAASVSTCASTGTQLGSVTYGLTPFATEALPASTASAGIGFYMQPTGTSTLLTLLPTQVDKNNVGNVMPYSAGSNGDQNLSIYAVDGSSGPVLVGAFDPDN